MEFLFPNIYDIMFTTDIVVITTNQRIWDSFIRSISKTEGWDEIRLHVQYRGNVYVRADGKKIIEYKTNMLGNQTSKPILESILKEKGMKSNQSCYGYFGIFNDDLLFLPNWYSEVKRGLRDHWCVSPGYIESGNSLFLNRAYELTKNLDGVVPLMQGACALFRLESVFRIGHLDEQFEWGCDDLDLAWRFHLNGIESVTQQKITVAHVVGNTRSLHYRRWNIESEKSKKKFVDKHGIFAYRALRNTYFKKEDSSHLFFKNITEQVK